MVKKRVHELAKELNIESKEIIKKLSQMGIEVKSHMSTVEDKDAGEILRQYRKAGQADEKKVSERTAKVSEAGGAPNAAAPAARGPKGDIRRDKEKNVLDAKKTDKNRGQQSGSRHRTDYNRGPGLVDRVPSRPPDRRFQEKPPEKQARPWASPKVEQQTTPKMVGSPPERPKFDKPQ